MALGRDIVDEIRKHSRSELLACRDHVVRRYQEVGKITHSGVSHSVSLDSDVIDLDRYGRSVLRVEADYVTGWVRATVGASTWPWSPGEELEDESIRQHIAYGARQSTTKGETTMTTTNATEKTLDEANQEVSDAMHERMMDARYAHLVEGVEDDEDAEPKAQRAGTMLEAAADLFDAHIFNGPTITGDPSALADVIGKMGDRAQREAQAVFDAKAGEMRKTLVGLGLIPTGEERVEAIRFMVSMGKALEQSRAAKLPYLVVNLSEEMPDKIDAQERASGCDAREGKLAWTYRKTAELEARFSATIRNTLREWPTHQGQPMTIHTQVDQGVFVLTLKPGKDTP